MTSSADHYAVLGIARDAAERDVKRAFFRLLKENPPEQKPKEYQRLRGAYDVLSDPAARKEYDSTSAFGEEIEALRKEAEALLDADEPNYDEAIRLLRKAVVLGPEIGLLRNLLGRCYLEVERPADALKQFEKAAQINPKNAAYHLNKGHALAEMGKSKEAEVVFREVWVQDEEDYAAPRALAALLHKRGWRRKAHEVLDKAIGADGKLDFQDFFCLYDKVHLHVLDGEHDGLERQLGVILRVAVEEPDRKFAAFMLSRTAADLFDLKVYTLSNAFMKAARELAPGDELVRDLSDASAEASAIVEGLLTVTAETSEYHEVVQDLVRIHAGLYLGHLTRAEHEERFEDLFDLLDRVMNVDPHASEIKTSLRRLKRQHRTVYALNDKFFKLLLDAPDAGEYGADCPYCSRAIIVEKWRTGTTRCPHCYRSFQFTGAEYERPDQPKPRSKPIPATPPDPSRQPTSSADTSNSKRCKRCGRPSGTSEFCGALCADIDRRAAAGSQRPSEPPARPSISTPRHTPTPALPTHTVRSTPSSPTPASNSAGSGAGWVVVGLGLLWLMSVIGC